jgi:hypothetical protein
MTFVEPLDPWPYPWSRVDELDEEVVTYCPACAGREFGDWAKPCRADACGKRRRRIALSRGMSAPPALWQLVTHFRMRTNRRFPGSWTG